MPTNNIQNVFSSKCPESNKTLINQTFKFDIPSCEGLVHSKHLISYSNFCLFMDAYIDYIVYMVSQF
jgi:hypothetical protein